MLRCIFVRNLESLTLFGIDLSPGQTHKPKMGKILTFKFNLSLKVNFNHPIKKIRILIKVFYISDPNLVILAWTVDELSHGQAHDWRTHGHKYTHTHAGNDNTRRPKLASGKKQSSSMLSVCEGYPLMTDEFPSQRASDAKGVSNDMASSWTSKRVLPEGAKSHRFPNRITPWCGSVFYWCNSRVNGLSQRDRVNKRRHCTHCRPRAGYILCLLRN